MDGHLPSKTRNQPTLLHYEYEIPFIFPNPGIISSTTTYVYNVSCYIYIYSFHKYIYFDISRGK